MSAAKPGTFTHPLDIPAFLKTRGGQRKAIDLSPSNHPAKCIKATGGKQCHLCEIDLNTLETRTADVVNSSFNSSCMTPTSISYKTEETRNEDCFNPGQNSMIPDQQTDADTSNTMYDNTSIQQPVETQLRMQLKITSLKILSHRVLLQTYSEKRIDELLTNWSIMSEGQAEVDTSSSEVSTTSLEYPTVPNVYNLHAIASHVLCQIFPGRDDFQVAKL